MTGWTPDRIDTLTRLWGEGLSASIIAKALGGISRSGVIGKLHRLGATGKDRSGTNFITPKRVRRARPSLAHTPEPVSEPYAEGESEPLTSGEYTPSHATGIPNAVTGLHPNQCRYPIGELDDPQFRFCSNRKTEGSSYCAGHHGITHSSYIPQNRPGHPNYVRGA